MRNELMKSNEAHPFLQLETASLPLPVPEI
ncbi:rCG45318 [Rattus norvegicus]|uniref:RCG45318 n=1 Tax=Rattus norvegicus TaxID=10116 RepID=A6K9B9_RAT|nr:rCG45318 [Rattus norvegicus]